MEELCSKFAVEETPAAARTRSDRHILAEAEDRAGLGGVFKSM